MSRQRSAHSQHTDPLGRVVRPSGDRDRMSGCWGQPGSRFGISCRCQSSRRVDGLRRHGLSAGAVSQVAAAAAREPVVRRSQRPWPGRQGARLSAVPCNRPPLGRGLSAVHPASRIPQAAGCGEDTQPWEMEAHRKHAGRRCLQAAASSGCSDVHRSRRVPSPTRVPSACCCVNSPGRPSKRHQQSSDGRTSRTSSLSALLAPE